MEYSTLTGLNLSVHAEEYGTREKDEEKRVLPRSTLQSARTEELASAVTFCPLEEDEGELL